MRKACVCSALTYQLPAIEVHAGQFAIVWLSDVDIKRLALVNVSSTICCHFQNSLLGNLPHRFVELLQIIWNLFNILCQAWKQKDSIIRRLKTLIWIINQLRLYKVWPLTWMDPFWAISWFFISSLHRPLSVRSFRRCGFTIYRRSRSYT